MTEEIKNEEEKEQAWMKGYIFRKKKLLNLLTEKIIIYIYLIYLFEIKNKLKI
jgi:hypothetical protein